MACPSISRTKGLFPLVAMWVASVVAFMLMSCFFSLSIILIKWSIRTNIMDWHPRKDFCRNQDHLAKSTLTEKDCYHNEKKLTTIKLLFISALVVVLAIF